MRALPSPAAPPPTAVGHDRLRGSVAVLLTAAVFLVPAGVVALRGFNSEASLVSATESAFVGADLSAPVADSALAELTAVWREFHLVKATLAGLLVLVLVDIVSTVRRRAEALLSWPPPVAAAVGLRRGGRLAARSTHPPARQPSRSGCAVRLRGLLPACWRVR